jgi:UPF0716 protein FxsA
MFFKLFILFTLIPVIELALLIKIGSIIGLFNTIAIVIMTALIGAYMVDVIGFLMVFPLSRNYIKKIAKSYLKRKMSTDELYIHRF